MFLEIQVISKWNQFIKYKNKSNHIEFKDNSLACTACLRLVQEHLRESNTAFIHGYIGYGFLDNPVNYFCATVPLFWFAKQIMFNAGFISFTF